MNARWPLENRRRGEQTRGINAFENLCVISHEEIKVYIVHVVDNLHTGFIDKLFL